MHPDAPVYPASITSQTIDVAGFTLTALRQSARTTQKSQTPVLCVHGWLDNAASFVPLMPFIENAEIVAIDLPGHGHSSSLGEAGEFNFLEIVLNIPFIREIFIAKFYEFFNFREFPFVIVLTG